MEAKHPLKGQDGGVRNPVANELIRSGRGNAQSFPSFLISLPNFSHGECFVTSFPEKVLEDYHRKKRGALGLIL